MSDFKCKEIVLPECIVFYSTKVIKSFDDLVPFILESGDEVRKNNPDLKCLNPDYCFVSYLNNEYKDKDIFVEYAQAVEDYGKESENIKFKKLPKQKAISLLYKGPYSNIKTAYNSILNHIQDHKFKIIAPIRECYIHGIWDTDDENNYLTELQVPIN